MSGSGIPENSIHVSPRAFLCPITSAIIALKPWAHTEILFADFPITVPVHHLKALLERLLTNLTCSRVGFKLFIRQGLIFILIEALNHHSRCGMIAKPLAHLTAWTLIISIAHRPILRSILGSNLAITIAVEVAENPLLLFRLKLLKNQALLEFFKTDPTILVFVQLPNPWHHFTAMFLLKHLDDFLMSDVAILVFVEPLKQLFTLPGIQLLNARHLIKLLLRNDPILIEIRNFP